MLQTFTRISSEINKCLVAALFLLFVKNGRKDCDEKTNKEEMIQTLTCRSNNPVTTVP